MNEVRPLRGDTDPGETIHLTVGPETVPGARELLAEGFVALESLTGSSWVADAWPEEHRRVLPETRPAFLTDLDDGNLWFVRSPWPTIAPLDALSLVWAGQSRTDPDVWLDEASAVFRLDEATALARVQELHHGE